MTPLTRVMLLIIQRHSRSKTASLFIEDYQYKQQRRPFHQPTLSIPTLPFDGTKLFFFVKEREKTTISIINLLFPFSFLS